MTIGSKSLSIKEPTDAILFLLDILSAGDDGFCFQGKLEDLVRRWYGFATSSSFHKSLALLDDVGCIGKEPNPRDKRENKLRLTSMGKRVAARVRSDRTKAIDPLLRALDGCAQTVRQELCKVLGTLVETAEGEIKNGRAMDSKKKKG